MIARPLGPVGSMLLLALLLAPALPGQEPASPVRAVEAPEGFALVKTINHPGSAAWPDAGLDVKLGDELYFEAEGSISIQKNNQGEFVVRIYRKTSS